MIYWCPKLEINNTIVKNLQIAWNYMPNADNLIPNITDYFMQTISAKMFTSTVQSLTGISHGYKYLLGDQSQAVHRCDSEMKKWESISSSLVTIFGGMVYYQWRGNKGMHCIILLAFSAEFCKEKPKENRLHTTYINQSLHWWSMYMHLDEFLLLQFFLLCFVLFLLQFLVFHLKHLFMW